MMIGRKDSLNGKEIGYLREILLGMKDPQQLAVKLMVTSQAVKNWEAGSNVPSWGSMVRLCELWNSFVEEE